MWHRLDKSSGMWYWVPQWQPLTHGHTPEDCQYAYWAPQREDGNQPPHPEPTAPAVQPEPPITECLQGQPGDTCQHAFCQPVPPSPKPQSTNNPMTTILTLIALVALAGLLIELARAIKETLSDDHNINTEKNP
jgi:hypothetical protein